MALCSFLSLKRSTQIERALLWTEWDIKRWRSMRLFLFPTPHRPRPLTVLPSSLISPLLSLRLSPRPSRPLGRSSSQRVIACRIRNRLCSVTGHATQSSRVTGALLARVAIVPIIARNVGGRNCPKLASSHNGICVCAVRRTSGRAADLRET